MPSYPADVLDELFHNVLTSGVSKNLLGSSADELSMNSQTRICETLLSYSPKDCVSLFRFMSEIMFKAAMDTALGPGVYTPQLAHDILTLDGFIHVATTGMPVFFAQDVIEARNRLRRALVPAQDAEYPAEASTLVKDLLRMCCEDMGMERWRECGVVMSMMVYAMMANTMAIAFWVFYYLLRHPNAFWAVRDEVNRLLPMADSLLDHSKNPWTRKQ